jgi:ribosome biogenesis protein ERB1
MGSKRSRDEATNDTELALFSNETIDLTEGSGSEEDSNVSDSSSEESFPELNLDSDTDSEGATSEEDGLEDKNELAIFPKARTVVSKITGVPKREYPDIEPGYDSDSSTEEVHTLVILFARYNLTNPIQFLRTRIALATSLCIGTTTSPI